MAPKIDVSSTSECASKLNKQLGCFALSWPLGQAGKVTHLIVGIVVESTNVTNGTVHRGKGVNKQVYENMTKMMPCFVFGAHVRIVSYCIGLAGSERA